MLLGISDFLSTPTHRLTVCASKNLKICSKLLWAGNTPPLPDRDRVKFEISKAQIKQLENVRLWRRFNFFSLKIYNL